MRSHVLHTTLYGILLILPVNIGWVVCISTLSREEEVKDLYTDSASVLLAVADPSVIQREEGLEEAEAMVSGRGLFREADPSSEDREETLSPLFPVGHIARDDNIKPSDVTPVERALCHEDVSQR